MRKTEEEIDFASIWEQIKEYRDAHLKQNETKIVITYEAEEVKETTIIEEPSRSLTRKKNKEKS